MAAKLRALRTLGDRAAAIAAPKLLEEVKKTAAAGTSPDGKAWAPLKRGGRALPKAADALSVRVVGHIVQLVLRGPYVLHNSGTGHAPQRRILPPRGVGFPARYREICKAAVQQAFREAMGAAS